MNLIVQAVSTTVDGVRSAPTGLLSVSIDWPFELHIRLNLWFFLLFVLLAAGIYWFLRSRTAQLLPEFEIDEADLGVGDQRIKLRPNYEDLQVAYRLWVELSTRKIGLPIDFEHDVLAEVYDSWYEFFQVTRELIKEIPASTLRGQHSTRKIINLSIDVLNEGIRPHLTRWQARFRRWYQYELSKTANELADPQELQTRFPAYEPLKADMIIVNAKLIAYRRALKQLVFES